MPSEPGEGRCCVTFLLGRHDMHYLSTLDKEPTMGQSTDSAKSKLVNPYTCSESLRSLATGRTETGNGAQLIEVFQCPYCTGLSQYYHLPIAPLASAVNTGYTLSDCPGHCLICDRAALRQRKVSFTKRNFCIAFIKSLSLVTALGFALLSDLLFDFFTLCPSTCSHRVLNFFLSKLRKHPAWGCFLLSL